MGFLCIGAIHKPPEDGYLFHYRSKKIRCKKHRGYARRARNLRAAAVRRGEPGANERMIRSGFRSGKNKSTGCYRTIKLPKYPRPPHQALFVRLKQKWEEYREKFPYGA